MKLQKNKLLIAVAITLAVVLGAGFKMVGNDGVQKGDTVSVHYTGTLADGIVFDSSEGREPLTFQAGMGQMIEGFDKAVIGMALEEEKTITIPADEAYGEHDASLVQEVPKADLVAANINPQPGTQIYSTASGRPMKGIVTEVSGDTVKVDFNHELAGKDLTFKIKIVEIKK